MDQELYSSRLQTYSGEIENPALRDSLNSVFERFSEMQPKLVEWDEERIGLCLMVPVDLPPLGNFEELDILDTEPIVIVFNPKNYPAIAPIVFTDRLNFPKDNLAHLYIARNDKPPAFCLVKGSMQDWYANKRLVDLVLRISNWLRDAVTGCLSDNGDQFDPLRLEGYTGAIVYDYDKFFEIVEKRTFFPDSNFAMAIFERKESSYVFKTIVNVENFKENYALLIESFKKEEDKLPTPHYHIGYVISSLKTETYSNFFIEKPTTLSELEAYGARYDVDMEGLKKFIFEYDISHFRGVPLIVAIKRPKNVIGYDGDIEFTNFVLVVGSEHKKDGTLDDSLEVYMTSHNQPLTFKKAKQISGNDAKFEGLNYVFGCGSLGSKIIMHLSRSGHTEFCLIDFDIISPHNMVRHALMGDSIGKSKVLALKGTIDEIFSEEESNIHAIKGISDPTLKAGFLNLGNWILDFTASESFYNTLINADNIKDPRIAKGSISDFGNLGILLIEGKGRGIRLDDMMQILYYNSKHISWISEWLQREYKAIDSSNLSINVGVGCNSETTVLADDKISLHAAYFTGILKKESLNETFEGGKIYLSRIITGDDYQLKTEIIHVKPFDKYDAINDPSWQIKYAYSIAERLQEKMHEAAPNETGGVFIGSINYKSKTVHVVDLIDAPTDSSANEVCFHRGIVGLPEQVSEINTISGGQLGYIGEWHSHPQGPQGMSTKDMTTVQRFKSELSELTTPLPVFLTIVTPNDILPYVF
jgi:hypothetical protein